MAKKCAVSKQQRQTLVPSVFWSGSWHIIKLHFPTNTLFISLHSNDFACVPLFVDAHFNQQTLIWGKKKMTMESPLSLFSISPSVKCECWVVLRLTFLSIFNVVFWILLYGLLRCLQTHQKLLTSIR